MQLTCAGKPTYLTYCTNIHAGESAQQTMAGLVSHVPEVRRALQSQLPDAHLLHNDSSFGLGLRISGQAISEFREPEGAERLASTLESLNAYTFTFNGFPYGNFHGTRVKAEVYKPDWRDPLRLQYTNELAHLLSKLLPPGCPGSISTVPGSFKSWITSTSDSEAIAWQLLQHVACLIDIKEKTGCSIALALEPEPCCLLETIGEAVTFFEQYLLSSHALSRLQSLIGRTTAECEQLVRDHLGICYDVCHAAVEYEDPVASFKALQQAGIAVPKIQLSSAMRLQSVTPERAARVARFAEPVYLHQVIQRDSDGHLTRFADLDEALAGLSQARPTPDAAPEWRIHFHVPIFLRDLHELDSTQFFLADVLDLQAREGLAPHLEVETYTWDVLPAHLRDRTVAEAIASELQWASSRLLAQQGTN